MQDAIPTTISDPAMRAIAKYRTHHSIIAIKKNCNSSKRFNFSFVGKKDISKEVKNLTANKATQNTDIPTKKIKENSYIFADFIFENMNNSISQSVFPSALQLANITPVHKKDSKRNKFQNILNNFFPNINVDSENVSVHNIACCQYLRNGNQLSMSKVLGALLTDLSMHLAVFHITF